jgi:hypothetical protein
MGAFKITNLAAGTVASDAARLDQVQGGSATFITAAGTDTITGTTSPALTAYATGNQFSFLVANTNTGAVTINVDGLGAKAITRTGTTALVAADMVAGQTVEIIYDGTRFQLVNGNSFTNLKVSGTLGVTGVATFTAQPIASSLTASLPIFTDGSKGLVSNTMTGTGNVVMSASPTFTGTVGAADLTTTGNTILGDAATDTLNVGAGGLVKDASGNVGIGTASPSSELTVGDGAGSKQIAINGASSGAGQGAALLIQNGGITIGAFGNPSAISGVAYSNILDMTSYYGLTFSTLSTERMRIDSSGNVGIGTASPVYKFDISGSDGNGIRYTAAGGVQMLMGQSGGTGYFGTITNHALRFVTNDVERMRIDSSGNVLIGTATQLATGFVSIKFNDSTTQGIGLQVTGSVSGADFIVFRNSSGTNIGSITRNTTTNAVLYNTSSDYRLKENVTPLSNALDKVIALKPVSWVWKDCDGAIGEGFIAHEVQEIIPAAVNGVKDAVDEEGNIKPQGMDASYLVATLTSAIQELKAIVDAQAVRIAALEA